jgi:demethylspheroidene O-methyltransferase
MIRHHGLFYADIASPVALLRGEQGPTRLGAFWPYAAGSAAPAPEDVAAYSELMAASQSLIIDDALECYPFARHRLMMDVGGGEGVFAGEVARRAPRLRVRVLDLPAVAARANDRFAEAGLAPRAEAQGGDAIAGPLPLGADLITFVRVLHDHDDAAANAMLRNALAALEPGGTLVIIEPMAGIPGVEPMGDAYFGFYLLAMGSGHARRPAEIIAMLKQAGFQSAKPLKTRRPLLTSAISATKPMPATAP